MYCSGDGRRKDAEQWETRTHYLLCSGSSFPATEIPKTVSQSVNKLGRKMIMIIYLFLEKTKAGCYMKVWKRKTLILCKKKNNTKHSPVTLNHETTLSLHA